MTRPWIAVGVIAACGHAAPPPTAPRTPDPPAASSAAAASPSAPAAPRPPRPRTDRAPIRLGGAPSWATATDMTKLRFCPGDRELVAVEETGTVRRYRVEDGAQLAVTPSTSAAASTRWDGVIDCRDDGAALTLDRQGSPVLIDGAGKVTTPPAPIEAESARFGPDGSVWALTRQGVVAWRGADVHPVVAAHEHAVYRALAEGGVYFEYVFESGKAGDDGTWMVRNGVRIRLPDTSLDMVMAASAPDGAVAIADEMMAYGWVVHGRTAGKRMLLLDQGGTHIKAIAVTDRWFVVVDAGGDVLTAARPGMRWRQHDKPCGAYPSYFMAMAVSHDDKRIALSCGGAGMRLFDIASFRQISRDAPTSAGDAVAWSPGGDQLATLAREGPLQIWRGAGRVARLADDGAALVWWPSDTELAGVKDDKLTTWTIADGAAHEAAPQPPGSIVARSPHGELVTMAERRNDSDRLTVLRGDTRKDFTLPDSQVHRIGDVAIDDAGTRVVVSRGQYSGQPASEVIDIDLAAGTIESHEARCTAVAAGDDFTVIAGTGGDLVRRSRTGTATIGHHPDVTALAVTHGVVAAGGADGTISLWSTAGEPLGALTGATAAIRALAFSRDATRLAGIGVDGTLVWDLGP